MKRIYITIDSMFDTRFTILNSLNLLEDLNSYINRVNDNFKYIGKGFSLLYKARNRNYLYSSKKTKVVYLIGIIASELKSKDNDIVELVIDIYPYQLLDSEIDSIKVELKNIFQTVDIITFINSGSEPHMDVLDTYDVVIDYYGFRRLNKWILSGLEANNRDTRLVCPYELIDSTILIKEKEDIEEHIETLNKKMYPFLYLDLVPPGIFSIDVNKKENNNSE